MDTNSFHLTVPVLTTDEQASALASHSAAVKVREGQQ